MILGVFTLDIRSFLLGIMLGSITGFLVSMFASKKELTLQKKVGLFMFWVWIFFHITAFFMEKDVPWLLDFVGFGATGSLVGISTANLVAAFNRKR